MRSKPRGTRATTSGAPKARHWFVAFLHAPEPVQPEKKVLLGVCPVKEVLGLMRGEVLVNVRLLLHVVHQLPRVREGVQLKYGGCL
jgi:hypothetical protein